VYSDKIRAAIIECLVYSHESPYPPIPAAAFLHRLRESLAWGKAEVDAVEEISMRILRRQLEHDTAAMSDEDLR